MNTTQQTPDPRPWMTDAEILEFMNLLTDAELNDPEAIEARIEKTHRVNGYLGWKAERILSSRQAKREAVEIAVCLQELTGQDWQTLPTAPDTLLIYAAADQYRISLNFNSVYATNGRILVSPSYDKDIHGCTGDVKPEERETITVSRSRKPAAIAADINRRLLSWYRPAQDRNREAIKAINARIDARESRVSLLVELAGPDAEVYHPSYNKWHHNRKKGDPARVEIGKSPTVTADMDEAGMMTLKIKGVSMETGLELLMMLKTIRQAEAMQQAERMKKAGL